MAINTRLLPNTSRQLGLGDNNIVQNPSYCLRNSRDSLKITCLNKGGRLAGDGDQKKPVAVKAVGAATTSCVVVSEPKTQNVVSDLILLLENVSDMMLQSLKTFLKQMPHKLYHLQLFMEKGILDCRFFTLFAVAGSLLASLLCFVEGCYIIVESYFHYFISLSQKSDLGHVVQLLIEAIDMFLVGNAMLMFGMGLYVMFVGTKNVKGEGSETNLSLLQTLPSLVGMESVMQAKTRIGHAVIMLLQVGVLEKFQNVPVSTGLDLACFAGAVFASSICVFLLSKLAFSTPTTAGS